MIKKIIFILLVFIIGNFTVLMPAETLSIKSENNTIPAKELYNVFKNDSEGAETKYSNKRVTVTGIALKIGPDVYTFPSVEVSETKNGSARVLCVLPYSDYLKLRKVYKGDLVTISGIVRRYSEKYDLVVMKECQIIE